METSVQPYSRKVLTQEGRACFVRSYLAATKEENAEGAVRIRVGIGWARMLSSFLANLQEIDGEREVDAWKGNCPDHRITQMENPQFPNRLCDVMVDGWRHLLHPSKTTASDDITFTGALYVSGTTHVRQHSVVTKCIISGAKYLSHLKQNTWALYSWVPPL